MKNALLAVLTAIVVPLSASADDGAASIAAGGIVVLSHEPRIVMAKEVLHIAIDKIIVDYDFRNETATDITTEVAFPIPSYDFAMEEIAPAQQAFGDFRLWIEGKPADCAVQIRAFVKNKDMTSVLKAMGVDIPSFGHATELDNAPDIARLTTAQRRQLRQAGLIDANEGTPLWRVEMKYYWHQTFPAHSTIHIRHTYTPVLGSTNSIHYGFSQEPDPGSAKELESVCLDSRLKSTLRGIANSKSKDAPYFYVDFILTSANTWKMPIEDFTLVVDRPRMKDSLANYVSFCWDGPVTKPDADHFSAHATDLIPHGELRIGFFSVEPSSY